MTSHAIPADLLLIVGLTYEILNQMSDILQACSPIGNKPLPEPTKTQSVGAIWHNQDPISYVGVKAVWDIFHQYSDIIMSAMVSQITGVSIACSVVYSGANQRKHQSSASLAFVRGFLTLSSWKLPFACVCKSHWFHNGDFIVDAMASKITSLTIFRRRSKKTSKHRVTGLCTGNSPGTGEFPAQKACNSENVFIWWRHHDERLHIDGLLQERLNSSVLALESRISCTIPSTCWAGLLKWIRQRKMIVFTAVKIKVWESDESSSIIGSLFHNRLK